MSNRNNRSNRYTAIPEVTDNLQSLATAVRALKQTVEVLSRQSGNEADWAATVSDVTNAVSTVTTQVTNNTDWSQLLNDPTIDTIFNRAAAKADRLAQDVRDDARIALAKLQTAFDNFKNGYADDSAVIKAAITQLETSVDDADAKISSEQITRTTVTQALAGRIDTVNAQFQGNIAAVTTDIIALTSADSAIAARIDAVTTASTNAKSYVQSTQPKSLATNDYWVDLNGSTPVVKQWTGSAFTTRTATISATAPSSPATDALWFDTTTSLLKLWSGSSWVTQAAFVQSRTPATVAVGDVWVDTTQANTLKRWNGTAWVAIDKNDNLPGLLLSSVVSESLSKTDGDRTTATRIDNLISVAPDGNSATINNTQITTATRTDALASDLTDLQVQTTGGSAGGFYRLLASSSPADGALAEFQVQVRAAQSGANSTYSTAGMRIQALSNGTSRVKFNADSFIIANSTDTYVPFAVTSGQLALNALIASANISGQLTTSQINGLGAFATLSKIPAASAATYIDNLAVTSALIANGAIVNAKIGDAEITNAKLVNATIQTAKIADAAITTAKIVDAAITSAKVGTAQIKTANIEDLAVNNEKIYPTAVTNSASGVTAGSYSGSMLDIYLTCRASSRVIICATVSTSSINGYGGGFAIYFNGVSLAYTERSSFISGVTSSGTPDGPDMYYYSYIGAALNGATTSPGAGTYLVRAHAPGGGSITAFALELSR